MICEEAHEATFPRVRVATDGQDFPSSTILPLVLRRMCVPRNLHARAAPTSRGSLSTPTLPPAVILSRVDGEGPP